MPTSTHVSECLRSLPSAWHQRMLSHHEAKRGAPVRAWLIAVLASSVACAGCSFVAVRPPPSRAAESVREPASSPARCTTSPVAPIVDSAIAGFQIVRTAIAVDTDPAEYGGSVINRDVDIAIGVTAASAFLASAIYGSITVSNCRAYRKQFRPPAEEETFSPQEQADALDEPRRSRVYRLTPEPGPPSSGEPRPASVPDAPAAPDSSYDGAASDRGAIPPPQQPAAPIESSPERATGASP